MKKLASIVLILILTICMANSQVIAAMDCNITLGSLEQVEVETGDTFEVDVKVSDIVSTRGLVTFGATLEYNKSNLELVEIVGKGDYLKPGYNPTSGKLLIEREPTSNNATMFTMKFKVLNTDNTKVELNDITASDGTGLTTISDKSYTAKVKQPSGGDDDNNPGDDDNKPGDDDNKPGDDDDNPGDDDNKPGDDNNKPGDDNKPGDNNKPDQPTGSDSTTKDEKLPQTGANDVIIPGILGAIAVIGVISFIKFKQNNYR